MSGKRVAALHVLEDWHEPAPFLTFYDPNGRTRAEFSLDTVGSLHIVARGADGSAGFVLSRDSEWNISLTDQYGQTQQPLLGDPYDSPAGDPPLLCGLCKPPRPVPRSRYLEHTHLHDVFQH